MKKITFTIEIFNFFAVIFDPIYKLERFLSTRSF